MKEDKETLNLNSLQLSPMIWHDAINHGVELSNAFSELLLPKANFKNWLKSGELEFGSLNLSSYNFNSIYLDEEYANSVRNDYYHKVGFVNELGVKETKSSITELKKHPMYNHEKDLFYVFRVQDLNHFVSLYFQHWLIHNTYYYWSRWQLYFDFLAKESEKTYGELYQYMWSCAFGRIEGYTHCFKDAEQYKKFRDKLDEITEQSKSVEVEFVRLRDSKEKIKGS